MDDKKILDLLWRRAEQGITALAARFGARLHSMAKNLLGSDQDAEECVADTYLALWNAIPPRRPEPLSPFVYRVGRNMALNRLRSNTAQKRSSYEVSLDELAGCIPAAEHRDRELGQALNAWLDGLKKEDRAIFLRRYWFGDSVQDIARSLGMSQNNVSVRLSRLRDRLRTYLTKEGHYL